MEYRIDRERNCKILQLKADGMLQKDIAKLFNISISLVCMIIKQSKVRT
jgi:transposase